MSDAPSNRGDGSTVLARAVRRLLRPLVRLLLEKQLEYPFVAGLLKNLYVEVAEQDLKIPDRRPTDSRISLLTGIHRREVKRIRAELLEREDIPSAVTTGALLVSRWIGDKRFVDDEGRPLPLPRRAPSPEPSFEALVASVTANIPQRSILDEWLRLGVVEVRDDGLISLVSESFVAEQGFDEKAYFFGRNLRDHIATGARNLLGGQPAFFDQSIYYHNLSRESAEKLAGIARENGAALLRKVNREALELQQQDADHDGASYRMTLGSYFYGVDEDEESTEASEPSGGVHDEE